MLAQAQTPAAPPKPAAPAVAGLTTDDQKTIYTIGLSIYKSLVPLDLSAAELEIVKRAMTDAAAGKPAIDSAPFEPKMQTLASARSARVAAKEKAASQAYLTTAAAMAGATKSASGLIYRELKPGSGASPKATDTVTVNYRGTFTNGTEFDSSYKRNEPAQFPLNGVIPCWTEGVQKMKIGGKSSLVCPSSIAYGDNGRPGIPGGSTLVFEIELLSIGAAAPAAK